MERNAFLIFVNLLVFLIWLWIEILTAMWLNILKMLCLLCVICHFGFMLCSNTHVSFRRFKIIARDNLFSDVNFSYVFCRVFRSEESWCHVATLRLHFNITAQDTVIKNILLILIKLVVWQSEWRLRLNEHLTHILGHIVHQWIGKTTVMVCLYSSDEYEFCITWMPFQMGQICVTALYYVCVYMCVVQTELGMVCCAGN